MNQYPRPYNQISTLVAQCARDLEKLKRGNDRVTITQTTNQLNENIKEIRVSYHGIEYVKIIKNLDRPEEKIIYLDNNGYLTQTTKRRMNAILYYVIGCYIGKVRHSGNNMYIDMARYLTTTRYSHFINGKLKIVITKLRNGNEEVEVGDYCTFRM